MKIHSPVFVEVEVISSGAFVCVAVTSGARRRSYWIGWGASGAGRWCSVTSTTGYADCKGVSSMTTGC